MTRSTIVLLLLAAVGGAGSATAETAPARGLFCASLDRVLEAAAEKPTPFASVHIDMINQADGSRIGFPGFNRSDCHIYYASSDETRGRRFTCSRNLAPPELTSANLAADTVRCLGREPSLAPRANAFNREYAFDLGEVKIEIEDSCTDECHVGRRVTYEVWTSVP